MKTIIALISLLFLPITLLADVTLFDSSGRETAFIDNDLRIYLWDGTPVAYIKKENYGNEIHVYGYNGNHLGWLEGGAIIDRQGFVVGATARVFANPPIPKTLPRLAKLPPLESLQKLAPLKPLVKMKWSQTDFRVFLLLGKKQ